MRNITRFSVRARAEAGLVAARAAFVLVTIAGCSDASDDGPETTRETIGDTTIVRIAGGSGAELTPVEELRIGELEGAEEYTFGSIDGLAVAEDGAMYVLDEQALTVRVFDAQGAHVRTFGRSGGGPGELKQPSGIAFLPDGRLIIRDPGNARMNVYSPDGESLASWPIPSGFFTSAPIFVDRAGNTYIDVIAERLPEGRSRTGLMRLDRDGTVVDTLRRPFEDYETPTVQAVRVSGQSRSMSMSVVPFWPQAVSTLNLEGEFVGGIADRYMFQIWRADSTVLRIERDLPPVVVEEGEAQTAVERTTRSMRRLDENWRWDAPRPPATKPPFGEIRVALDGRIWVRLAQPAERRPPDPDARPDPNGLPPLDRWVSPMVYDVFEADGDFVGTARFPERFNPMVIRGEYVWGVVSDELDVDYVVRMRLNGVTTPPTVSPAERRS